MRVMGWPTPKGLGSVMTAGALFCANPGFAEQAPSHATSAESGTKQANASGKASRGAKKKRGVPADDANANPGEAHSAQIGGSEKPYFMEVSLLSDLSRNSSKTTVGDESVSTGSGVYDMQVKSLFVLKHRFLLGPNLTYSETTTKSADTTDKSSNLDLDLLGQFCFGNIDEDVNVFFVEGGLGYGMSQSKSGDTTAKGTETKLILGFGLHHFVDSNVALTGQMSLEQGNEKSDGGTTSTIQVIHFLTVGFSLFI